MKVGELIELLKEHDAQLEVLIDTRSLCDVEIKEIPDFYSDGSSVVNIET